MGMRQAINAKCKECIFDSRASGKWRQQTEACRIESCPLHPYRPLATGRAKAVKAVKSATFADDPPEGKGTGILARITSQSLEKPIPITAYPKPLVVI